MVIYLVVYHMSVFTHVYVGSADRDPVLPYGR